MTLRFGEIEIDEKMIIEMPDGIIGFEERRFVILSPDENGSFFWLQSLDNPDLAFVVTDPSLFVQGYEVNPTPDECARIELENDSEVIVLAVVTMASDVKDTTVNLQGPILVNPSRMLAKQIVLEEGRYKTKHPLFSGTLPASTPSEEAAPPSPSSLGKITTICSSR